MNHMKRLQASPAQRSKRSTAMYPDRWDLSDLIHDPVEL